MDTILYFQSQSKTNAAEKLGGVQDVAAKCGNASARVDFLWPEGLALSQTDAFDPPIAYGLKLVQHHLTAATVQPATHALFVTLIAPYRTGTPPPPKAKFEKTPSGFRVTWPDGVIACPISSLRP